MNFRATHDLVHFSAYISDTVTMPRYSEFEQSKIKLVREHLSHRINETPQYPDVIGDRKILRFLRGHDFHMEKVCQIVSKYLDWRKEHKVDEIRQNILLGGLDCPSKFPYASIILKYQPQAVICPEARDKNDCPICVEKFNFSPNLIAKHLTIEQYVIFFIHSLEYKSLILEQLSEERDQEYLNSLSEEHKAIALSDTDSDILPPYGTLAGLCIIRDLEGLGFEHIGELGREIISSAVKVSSDNYPELLSKAYMINSPWIFNTLWWFIQGLLAPKTVAKVSLSGADFKEVLLQTIEPENIPNLVGGPYSVEHSNVTSFIFSNQYFYPDLTEEDMRTFSQQLLESNAEILAQAHVPPLDPTTTDLSTKSNPVVSTPTSTHSSATSPVGKFSPKITAAERKQTRKSAFF